MDRFRVGLEEIPVHGQDEREVVPAGIRLDDRLRRAVLFDGTQNGGIAGIARLGKFKLLQAISYAPVPVLLGEKTELLPIGLLESTGGLSCERHFQ